MFLKLIEFCYLDNIKVSWGAKKKSSSMRHAKNAPMNALMMYGFTIFLFDMLEDFDFEIVMIKRMIQVICPII